MKFFRSIAPITFPLVLFACGGSDAEKNENEGTQKDTTVSSTGNTEISVEALDQRVRNYIENESKGNGGRFKIEKDGNTLSLKLVRVHTEYISTLGPQRHFACVDLAAENGDVYDVDFFLEGKKKDLTITQQTVHKRNGIPFYTWEQKPDNTWHKVSVEKASKEVKGVIEGEDAFRFHYEATLPEMDEKAELWMPIATSDSFQNVERDTLIVPGKHRMLKEKGHGNRILYVELKPEHSGKKLRVSYEVQRMEKPSYKDPSAKPENFLVSDPLMPINDRFERISKRILQGKEQESQLVKARALFEHVLDTVEYKKAGKYGTGDAEYACTAAKGNCTEFHSYFIALARSAGIPARFSIGASIPSGRDKGGVNGYHCWAEFFANGKWWPVDISEAKKYRSLKTYYFGHHPANRIELSDGRQLKVKPSPKSGLIDFLAYPLLEVGGKKEPVETSFSFNRKELS